MREPICWQKSDLSLLRIVNPAPEEQKSRLVIRAKTFYQHSTESLNADLQTSPVLREDQAET